MPDENRQDGERVLLRQMRRTSLFEGATLVALVCIAVPLKHVAGDPMLTSIMGPIHGIAFLIYMWTVIHVVSAGGWRKAEIARLVAAAFVPFGAFLTMRLLKRKAAALEGRAGLS